MRVVGIGQCSWDYLAVVDSFPASDTKAEVSDWQEQGGGPAATALVTLARLGVPCDFHGVVGDDQEGEKIRKSLISEGVGISCLVTRLNALSQKAFIAIEKSTAKRTIYWERPSGPPLLPEELPGSLFNDCSFLLLDGLMSEVSLFAANRARTLGIPIMLDAGKVRPGMLEIAGLCDYLVASEQFALDLGWDGNPADFQDHANRLGAAVVTITLGGQGSITYRGSEIILTRAFQVDALDTTGAGDVFHGAYIFGLLRGLDLTDTILFASAVAALKCRRIGGRTGIPDKAESLQFLAENGITMQFRD
jgi:sulfofructose kinase